MRYPMTGRILFHHTRFALAWYLGILLLVLPGGAWSASAIQALPDQYGCEDIDSYFTDVYWGAIETEEDYEAIQTAMDADDPLVLRRSQQLEAAQALERWAENLENVPVEDVPVAVRGWHDATVKRFSLTSNMFYALSEGAGAFDLMLYTDSLEEVASDAEQGWDEVERLCGEEWTSHFPRIDGTSDDSDRIDYEGLSVQQPPITQATSTPEAGGMTPYQGATLGDPNAPVTFAVYADYQCHFCKQFHDEFYPQIIDDFVRDGQVKIEFREFPALGVGELTDDSNESAQAAEAALCAGEQDQYLQYHDYLYANFGGVNLGGFSNYRLKQFADDLGLDTNSFNECLDSGRYQDAVVQSRDEGRALGISATPMFVIDNGNGEPNVVQQTSSGYDLLRRQIQAAVDSAP